MRTYSPKPGDADRQWLVIDAADVVLGRLATQAAALLRGKHKPTFAPHADMGDFVIIINADKIRLTGRKWTMKEYVRHTGYPGGQRKVTPAKLIAVKPTMVLEKAIYGMIPKNRLGEAIKGNLYLYAGTDHPHAAQQPKAVTLKY